MLQSAFACCHYFGPVHAVDNVFSIGYMQRQGKGQLPLIIPLSVLVLLIAAYFVFPSFKSGIDEAFSVLTSGDRGRIERWVSRFGIAGPLVLILSMIVSMLVFFPPTSLLLVISTLSYGPVWGSLISIIGVLLASAAGYGLGRALGPVTLRKMVSPKTQEKLGGFVDEYGIGAVIITRMSPLLSNEAISLIAGLLRMGFRKYILATIAGIMPLIVILAIGGDDGKMRGPLIWISVVSIVLYVLYIILDRRRKRKKRERQG